MRTFAVYCPEPRTKIIEGVEFSDGTVAVRWTSRATGEPSSTVLWASMEDFQAVSLKPEYDRYLLEVSSVMPASGLW